MSASAHTKESRRSTATKSDRATLEAAWDAISDAHDATNLARDCFDDLATLFGAITQACDKDSRAARLAKIGLYLAEDWANLHDGERESLEEHVTALRAALAIPELERRKENNQAALQAAGREVAA